MSTTEERLKIANDKFDAIAKDIWAQAERNLKKSEEEYKKRVSEKEGRDK